MSERHERAAHLPESHRRELQADCEDCFGLCCVALSFAVSADFAIHKDVGQPCPNLQPDFRCGVHGELRERGFRGCTVYDCFGAGQKVSQGTFAGRDWRQHPEFRMPMFDAFAIMRQLHESLWYLNAALAVEAARPLHGALRRSLVQTERLTQLDPKALSELDIAAHRADVNALLLRTSELARTAVLRQQAVAADRGTAARGRGKNLSGSDFRGASLRGADLMGADLRRADLRGADLRGALLIAADLQGADLRAADLIGADLRDTDLRGADLTQSLFLTQSQVTAARGNSDTRLPQTLTHPEHWPVSHHAQE